ncbi:MAG TPA: hypothetical protein VK445_02595 [Dissulfurispiraceae bacterium]|nr:hypothetical protein [Dissulfurispiraceae bacterium]
MSAFQKKLLAGLVIMALMSPLGIYLPQLFKSVDAWGEWSPEKLKELIGFVPAGLERLADLWKAPIPDYNAAGEGASFGAQAFWYVASALAGIAIGGGIAFLLGRALRRRDK